MPVSNARATNAKAAVSLFRARPARTLATAPVPVGSLPTVRESYLRSREMNLYLQKVTHAQAHENYRVVLKLDGDEFEIGSISIQHDAAWRSVA